MFTAKTNNIYIQYINHLADRGGNFLPGYKAGMCYYLLKPRVRTVAWCDARINDVCSCCIANMKHHRWHLLASSIMPHKEHNWWSTFPQGGGGSCGRFLTGDWHEEGVNGNNQVPRNHVHCIHSCKMN